MTPGSIVKDPEAYNDFITANFPPFRTSPKYKARWSCGPSSSQPRLPFQHAGWLISVGEWPIPMRQVHDRDNHCERCAVKSQPTAEMNTSQPKGLLILFSKRRLSLFMYRLR